MINIYEEVTTRILKQLEAGQIPWRKTWSIGLPKSLNTGKEYRGINILILNTAGFSSRYWITYRQAELMGGHVRKGEKATTVVYWKWRTKEDLVKLRVKTGKDKLAPCVPFVSNVFNYDQVEGIAEPEDNQPNLQNNRLEIAEMMLDVMPSKPEILHSSTTNPVYHRVLDRVTLPHLSHFESADEYYGTLFHELVHSTGHAKRLDRFAEAEGDKVEKYSFEELVAEFGAAFLCGFTGISNPNTDALQASYIDGWSQVFKKDSRIILRAASAAQKAADYVRGKFTSEELAEAA